MPTTSLLRQTVGTGGGEVVLHDLRPRYSGAGADVHLHYRLIGPPDLPVVAVLGGIAADADVLARDDGSPGWWSNQVGQGLGVDTRRYRILSFDFLTRDDLGGSRCSAVSSADQATALAALLVELDIDQLHALIGASYGAMVGLAFAASYPELLQRLIAISGAHRAHPFASALRGLQREIIQSDSASETTMAFARALALTTYLTPDYFAERFPEKANMDDNGFHSEALSYLLHHGRKFATQANAERYLDLSESLDLHWVEPESIATPTTLIAADPDSIVPLSQMRELLGRLGGPANLRVVESSHGHDAFLKEHATFAPLLRDALQGGHRHVA